MFNRTFSILTALMTLLRFTYSQNNRQNLHRRSTVPRIPTAQAESSTESEEEDDRVLDGKVVSPLKIIPVFRVAFQRSSRAF